MSLALPTLTLIFLLTPGLIFRRFYFSGEFSHQYFKSSFTDLLISTLVPNVFIHVLLYYVLIHPTHFVDTNVLSIVLSGTSDVNAISKGFAKIYEYAKEIIGYLTIASVVAMIGGLLSKTIVRGLKLDRRFKLFRFKNQWHYLFSGEILDFPNMVGKTEEVSIKYIDALVDCADGSVLYSGILSDYQLSKEGGIDCIYLSDVTRRFMKDDDGKGVYYKMPGNFFVIPFNKIINLHITYYSVQVENNLQPGIDSVEVD